jgi:hypothetical protein
VFGPARGAGNVREKPTVGRPASASGPGSPRAARPAMSRWVVAPVSTGCPASGGAADHARYSGPRKPHQPGQPAAAPSPSSQVMKSTSRSATVAPFSGSARR